MKADPKIFCVGFNKTGTTTLLQEFKSLGYATGNPLEAQLIANRHYFRGEFRPIINYCATAQVFQDAPFSYPGTFRHLDDAFPGSRFILSVRDSADQWYSSLTRFHAKLFGNGRVPTCEDLRRAERTRIGYVPRLTLRFLGLRLIVQRAHRLPVNTMRLYGTRPEDPYNREMLTSAYNRHNEEVREHFHNRPGDLLEVNVARPEDYQRFLDFLGARSSRRGFLWAKSTDSVQA